MSYITIGLHLKYYTLEKYGACNEMLLGSQSKQHWHYNKLNEAQKTIFWQHWFT